MAETKFSDSVQKQLNGVAYESLPETTIAVSRTMERQFFQKSTYNSGVNEAICDWNTGAKFINARRSYLTFTVKTDAGTANFGHGSACNLIRRVVLTTRSGTELSRTEDYNILMAKIIRYDASRAYVQQFGEILGFEDDASVLGLDGAQLSTTAKRFIIPLVYLSPFFMGDGKALVPPQAGAGLRVQITFAPDAQALISDTTPVYEVDDISIMTNVTMMVDSWTKKINEESARDGLTYSYPEYHTTQSSLPIGQGRINIEVRKAVARALCAFTVTKTDSDGYSVDNMKSDIYDYTSVEWRLGSLYPTQQPITSVEEAYFIAQSCWDSDVLDPDRGNSVSLSQFTNSSAVGESTGVSDGDAICVASLERNDVKLNQVLNIGGLQTNNSRTLAVDITAPLDLVNPRSTFLYMKHLRVVKLFLDNAVVSE